MAEPAGDGERQDGGDALRRDGGAGPRVRRGPEEVQQVTHKAQTGREKIYQGTYILDKQLDRAPLR